MHQRIAIREQMAIDHLCLKHAIGAVLWFRLLAGANSGLRGLGNHLLLMRTYRRGLRVSEAISVRRDEFDRKRLRPWVRRLNNGLSVEQPIPSDQLRAIKHYLKLR